MKKRFTMIEILVVMSIILVLTGLLVPAVSKGMKRAKIQKTHTAIKTLQMAIKQYETTYGYLPGTVNPDDGTAPAEITPATDYQLPSSSGFPYMLDYQKLLATLTAEDIAYNPKNIQFLNAEYDESNNPVYLDSWGKELTVSLDLDYDRELADDKVAGWKGGILKTTIAIWSDGPDGSSSTTNDDGDENKDNVNSWQKIAGKPD